MPEDKGKVEQLIAIVKGEPKGSKPGNWKNLWREQLVYPSYDEQLAAVEKLGETENQRALDFLKQSYETPTITEESGIHPGNAPGEESYSLSKVFEYKKVGEPLKSKLTFEVNLLLYPSYANDLLRDPKDIRKDEREIPARIEAHQIFKSAIEKLENVLQVD